MYKAFQFLFFQLVILSFFSCESEAKPKEPKKKKTHFKMGMIPLPDEPKKFGSIDLSFLDTNSKEWRNTIYRLDSFYKTQVAGGFNGGVLVGYKGLILYERYYGYANKESKTNWAKNTSSQLASTSKTMTAGAVLYLNEHRYLNINDPVSTYIENFPYKDITVKHLLSHRSGLPDYLKWTGRFVKDLKTPMTNDDIVSLMVKNKPAQDYKTNTAFKYSNTNYVLLATIIERVTDMSYSEFMKKYIFEPLQMTNTFVYNPNKGLLGTSAISYKANWVREPDMFADGVYGDKGIYSSTRDLYKWDQSFYKNYLLDNETIEMAYGPCSFEKPGIKNYGLGWRMLCYPDGYKVIFHNGWWHGNNTCFYRFVKDNFTIIVLGNKYNSRIYKQPPVIYGIVKNLDSVEQFGEME